jgi:capsular exopolysaccharide synthesis family protein
MTDSFKNKNIDQDVEEIDLKGIFFDVLAIWPYILVSVIICFFVAFGVNYFAVNVYQVSSIIQIKEKPNPFSNLESPFVFESNASKEKVLGDILVLKSYAHNKKVIETINGEVSYFRIGKLRDVQLYHNKPFLIEFDSSHVQLIGQNFTLNITDDYRLNVFFDKIEGNKTVYQYLEEKVMTKNLVDYELNQTVDLNEWIESPYFKFRIRPNTDNYLPGENIIRGISKQNSLGYYFRFQTYHSVVNSINSKLNIAEKEEGTGILQLKLVGSNIDDIAEYLNSSIEIFTNDNLSEKNLMAKNTVRFLDQEIQTALDSLMIYQKELELAQEKYKSINLSTQADVIYTNFSSLDQQESQLNTKIDYFEFVLKSIKEKKINPQNFIPPSTVGLDEPAISQSMSELISLSTEKNKLGGNLTGENPVLKNIDLQIENALIFLEENLIGLIQVSKMEVNQLNKRKQKLEKDFSELPFSEQSVLTIKRKHNVVESQYTYLLEKRSEAGMVMAANSAGIRVIESARNIGQGPVTPNRRVNYIISLIIGIGIPIGLLFLRMFFKSKIENLEDVKSIIGAPVIGVIGHSKDMSFKNHNDNPTSAISEGYRALRTNCNQFMNEASIEESSLKISSLNNGINVNQGKVILVTSLVEAEGKSVNTLNLALSYVSGGYKTVVIDADLRKHVLHKRMNLKNITGLSNYIEESAILEEVIQSSEIENLDFITAGLNPKNPGELVLSSRMKKLVADLKLKYDVVLIDTPPIGLVSDAKQLMALSDINLHVVRQNVTSMEMLGELNNLFTNEALEKYHIVLNDVVEEKGYHPKYGLAYSYGHSYSYSYEGKYYQGNK